jgi:hypothetical protein
MTFEGDLILAGDNGDDDTPEVLAVLSPRQKRKRIPDESIPLERAEWIGQQGAINGKPVVYIDAVKWRGVWYVQYSEVT